MLSRFGCFGTCPYYEVQVFGDGRVEWSGGRFVEVADRKTYRIATSEAEQLLRRFRTPEVWALCGDYSRRVTDNASVSVKIAAGSANKNIRDYADSAPLWFRQLQVEINRVADTHTLRHGAAETEALIHIREEYLPKPGITDLMRATVRGDLALAKQALDAGAVVDATDSSGWTALMYAAASYGNRKILEELLRRRANPEQVSPFGDTVLMAASLRGSFDPALARLGNNINAQNRDGVSALMLIASRGRYEEIEAALNAGADPNLRDKQGHTALNYLEARNCRRSLVS
ncbi:MAG: ankyrin repeat domain-containing protein [Bryobacteraceae bacterium]